MSSLAFVPSLIVTAAVAAALARFAARRRPSPGAGPLVWLMLGVAEWSLAYAAQLASVTLEGKLLWAKVKYVGIVIAPVAGLLLALEYTRRETRSTHHRWRWLMIVPVTTLIGMWTTDVHWLFYSSASLDVTGAFPMLASIVGPWFWVHTTYSYLALVVSTFLFIRAFVRSPSLYRRQAGAVLLGGLMPWAGNGHGLG